MITDKWCGVCRALTKHLYHRLRWNCLVCERKKEEEEIKFRKEMGLCLLFVLIAKMTEAKELSKFCLIVLK